VTKDTILKEKFQEESDAEEIEDAKVHDVTFDSEHSDSEYDPLAELKEKKGISPQNIKLFHGKTIFVAEYIPKRKEISLALEDYGAEVAYSRKDDNISVLVVDGDEQDAQNLKCKEKELITPWELAQVLSFHENQSKKNGGSMLQVLAPRHIGISHRSARVLIVIIYHGRISRGQNARSSLLLLQLVADLFIVLPIQKTLRSFSRIFTCACTHMSLIW